MSEHIAPMDAFSSEERQRLVDDLTPEQRQAIALTLEDLRGWATLHGQLRNFDPRTGAELAPPVRIQRHLSGSGTTPGAGVQPGGRTRSLRTS